MKEVKCTMPRKTRRTKQAGRYGPIWRQVVVLASRSTAATTFTVGMATSFSIRKLSYTTSVRGNVPAVPYTEDLFHIAYSDHPRRNTRPALDRECSEVFPIHETCCNETRKPLIQISRSNGWVWQLMPPGILTASEQECCYCKEHLAVWSTCALPSATFQPIISSTLYEVSSLIDKIS